MGWVFLLGLWVEDNIADSPDNHISPPYKGWIWGSLDCPNNLILRSLFGARLMFEHTRTYEEETSFNLELNHLFNSSICILARSNAWAFYQYNIRKDSIKSNIPKQQYKLTNSVRKPQHEIMARKQQHKFICENSQKVVQKSKENPICRMIEGKKIRKASDMRQKLQLYQSDNYHLTYHCRRE